MKRVCGVVEVDSAIERLRGFRTDRHFFTIRETPPALGAGLPTSPNRGTIGLLRDQLRLPTLDTLAAFRHPQRDLRNSFVPPLFALPKMWSVSIHSLLVNRDTKRY